MSDRQAKELSNVVGVVGDDAKLTEIGGEHLGVLKKSNRSLGSPQEVKAAVRPVNSVEAELPATICELAIDELTVVELRIVDSDGLVSYGPVSHYLHRASSGL